MSDRGPREEVANILRQFHSRSCYPQAMDFEVDAAVDALLHLLTEPISDAGHTVADGLVLRPCPHCGEKLVLKGDHHGEWWGHKNDMGSCIHAITQLHDKEDFAAWNRRSPIAPTAVKALEDGFRADEFAHVAALIRQYLSDDASFRAVMSNNFNVILAALDRCALSPKAEPECYVSQKALDELHRDGSHVGTKTVIWNCGQSRNSKTRVPLYRRPQPAEGWREALTLIRHFADTVNERNYADKRLYLLQHIDRLLASPPVSSASIVETIRHNGRRWWVVKIGSSFFARDDNASDTGPYSTPEQAVEWILAIAASQADTEESK